MADFRAFYRLSWRQALALSGPEFLALAYRTPAYGGVMAARVEAERDSDGGPAPAGVDQVRMVDADRRSLQADPVLAAVIDFG